MRHGEFHQLPVVHIEQLTGDAHAVTFAVPPELAQAYDFTAGQHLNVHIPGDPDDERRSYSVCTPQGSGRLTIGVKLIPGGRFSQHLADELRLGSVLDVMTPVGMFTHEIDPQSSRRYVFVAAGSGITPVLSLAATILAREPHAEVSLIYGNRRRDTVMFADELADLKDTYPARLQVLHVLSREPGDSDLLTGRITTATLDRLFERELPPGEIADWFLCGPYLMVRDLREHLIEAGVPRRNVHAEVFHVDENEGQRTASAPAPADVRGPDARVTVSLAGRRTTVDVPREGVPVLEAVLKARPDAPFACRGGVCGTCRARVRSGEVRLDTNWALEPDELAAGYVLTCQAHPTTDEVELDYDA